jgi:hypothetical protein
LLACCPVHRSALCQATRSNQMPDTTRAKANGCCTLRCTLRKHLWPACLKCMQCALCVDTHCNICCASTTPVRSVLMLVPSSGRRLLLGTQTAHSC